MRGSGIFTYENALLVMLGVTFGVVFMDRSAVNYLAPFIVHDLHLTSGQVGLISAALAVTWSLTNIGAGRLSDLMGRRKPLLVAAVVVFSLCSFVSGLATSFAMLVAARLFMGLSEGPAPPLVLALMAESSSKGRLGLNSGLIISSFRSFFAGVLGPVLLIGVAQAFSWRVSFWIAAVPGLIMAALIAVFVREGPRLGPGAGQGEGAGSGAAPPPAGAKEPTVGFLQIVLRWNIVLCTLIGCFTLAALIIGLSFTALYLVDVRHIAPTQVSLLLGAQGLANMGAFLVPTLSERIGRKPAVIVFSLVAMVTPLAILYMHGSLWGLGALLVVGGLANGVTTMLFVVIPAETVAGRHLGTAVGFIPGVGELVGAVCGPALAGWAADLTSLAAPFVIMTGCSLAAGLLGLGLKETLDTRPLAALAPEPAL